MAMLLGVDTGGTYTDAVLIEDEKTIIASAKSLTTRHDLAIGVGGAVQSVLAQSGVKAGDISLASLSTTLATNALVEGQGGRVALIYIGFREKDLEAHGLKEVLKGDPYIVLSGGHGHDGAESQSLDEAALSAFLHSIKDEVSGFAVAAKFATRNPSHEQKATEIIYQITGKPVSASHELSAKLNGPKRALTAVLNARLIGMIDRLIGRAQQVLLDMDIQAPLMVVRGDGALISAQQARERPIETILSGPAASIVGARWMTGVDHALVSDIGGTTTDVALIKDGRPAIDPAGARVGPYRTMVEAVAMRTHGLGGDSEVHFISEGLQGGIHLGPQRVLPVSLLGAQAPEIVHEALDSQLRSTTPGEFDGRFVRALSGQSAEGLDTRAQALLDRLGNEAQPMGHILKNRLEHGALKKLVTRGLAQICALTPSDASHVLGRVQSWDRDAAEKALLLFGRRRTGSGNILSKDPQELAQMIVDQLTHQTSLALLETAFGEEETPFGLPEAQLAAHVLTQRGLDQHRGLLRMDIGLNLPVVGLGASAASYYPAVADRLGCEMILPEHAGVANAIGAVVGRVTMRRSGTVTSPSEGVFRVHHADNPKDFTSAQEAMDYLEALLSQQAEEAAKGAGAEDIQLQNFKEIQKATTESREVFIEATLTAQASGRPRVAK